MQATTNCMHEDDPQIMQQATMTKTPNMRSKTPLSSDFTPGEFDVICSRGKLANRHPGNLLFHSMIQRAAPKYAIAEGKLSKSLIVSDIIITIRRQSSRGGFVKRINDRWYEVGDWNAREKVSQALRNLIGDQYRSSATSKKRRKDAMHENMIDYLDALIDKNEFICGRIRYLSDTIKSQGILASDAFLTRMMTQVNTEILSQIKEDKALRKQVHIMGEQTLQRKTTGKEVKKYSVVISSL